MVKGLPRPETEGNIGQNAPEPLRDGGNERGGVGEAAAYRQENCGNHQRKQGDGEAEIHGTATCKDEVMGDEWRGIEQEHRQRD